MNMEYIPTELSYTIFEYLKDVELLSLAYVSKRYTSLIVDFKGCNTTLGSIISYIFMGVDINYEEFNVHEFKQLIECQYMDIYIHILKCYNKSKFIGDSEKFDNVNNNVSEISNHIIDHTIHPHHLYALYTLGCNIINSNICYKITYNIDVTESNSTVDLYIRTFDMKIYEKFNDIRGHIYNILLMYILKKGSDTVIEYYKLYPNQMFSLLVCGIKMLNTDILVNMLVNIKVKLILSKLHENILYKVTRIPELLLIFPHLCGMSTSAMFHQLQRTGIKFIEKEYKKLEKAGWKISIN